MHVATRPIKTVGTARQTGLGHQRRYRMIKKNERVPIAWCVPTYSESVPIHGDSTSLALASGAEARLLFRGLWSPSSWARTRGFLFGLDGYGDAEPSRRRDFTSRTRPCLATRYVSIGESSQASKQSKDLSG